MKSLQKLYYSISEVAELVDEEQHILRYWEKEFDELKPKKNRGGNRIYSEKDILLIKKIKGLLRGEKLSLKGAKEQISSKDGKDTEENLFTKHEIKNELEKKMARSGKKIMSKKGAITLEKKDVEELKYILNEILSFIK